MLQKLYVSTNRMKLMLLTTFMVLASTVVSSAQTTLGQYLFTGSGTLVATPAKRAASSVNSNVVFSDVTSVGLTDANTNNVANFSQWSTNVVNTGKYIEFTITPNSGVTFSVTQISVFTQRSSTGARSIQVRSSLDSYADSIARKFNSILESPGSTDNLAISGHTGLTSAVTFRIYGYTANAATGTLRFDNLTVTGTAVGSTPELTLAGTTYPFNGSTSTAGASQSFTISGANLTGAPGNISVSGPAGYEFSLDNSSFSAPLNVPYSSATLSLTTLYARIAAGASPTGELPGNIVATGGSATSNNLAVTGARSATFTPGNLVVLRAGDGVVGLGNTGNPISFVEYSPAAPGSPINVTNAAAYGTTPILQSNNATSEGQVTRTPDGSKLVFVGYKQSLPNATSLTSFAAPTVPRIISTIDNNGNYTEGAVGGSAFTLGNIRGGVSTGSTYIASGQTSTVGQAGVRGGAGFATQLSTAFTNTRHIKIQNGRLMFNNNFNSGLLNIGIISLGLGVDGATANQQEYQVNNAGTGADPYDFAVSPSGKTIYVADARPVGTTPTSTTGGIQRWDFNTSTGQYTWTKTYPTSSTSTALGAPHLIVEWGTTTNTIYCVSGVETGSNPTPNNNLLKIIDDGSASGTYSSLVSGGKIVVLASAGTNRLFRGVEFAPSATPEKKLVLTTYGPGGITGYFQATSINDGNMGSGIFGTSKIRTFYVSGTALTSTNINVSLSGAGAAAFGVRIGGSGAFASSVAIPAANIDVDGNLFAIRIDVEFNASAPAATSNATITVSGGGATLQTLDISATSVEPLNYYLRNTVAENSSVDLSDLSNWTDAVSGIGGSSPADLSSDGQIFNINKSVTAITSPFSVSGASSEINIVSGKTLTTSAVVTGSISLEATATLNITETGSAFSFNSVSPTSTVIYGASGAQSIPAIAFGNLTLSGSGDKTLADNIDISGNLTINDGPTASVGSSSTNVYVRGNINLSAAAAFSSNWAGFAVVRFAGTGTQAINGPGVFRATELRIIDKASGAVNLATNANIGTFTSNGVANFADGGNTITMTNNLQLTGDGGRYNLTGTIVFAGTSGSQQVRNANGVDGVIVAQLNNVTCSQAGATVNFQPSSGSGTIIVKGNFTVNTSNSINLNSNTLSIRGNLVRQSGSWTPAQTSVVEFAGSGSPSITGTGVVTFGGLRVALSGINSLTIPADLNIRGTLNVASGVLGTASRKVTFNGTAAQTIVGTFTAQDVEINNTAGVTVLSGGNVNISRELKLNANNALTINSGGSVKLLSTATQTAYLSAVPSGASISGNLTQDRYLHLPGVSGWYFWASPVKGQTIANLHSQVPQKGFSGVLTGNPTFYFLDETQSANNGWVAATNVTNSIGSGIGFRSYATVSQLTSVGNKLSFTGVPVVGNGVDQINTGGSEEFIWTLSNTTTGYNLLGNPYPSALLWDNTSNWSLTNVSPTIHKWDASTASYKVWNRVTASGTATNGVIPTGAAFVAQTDGPGASSLGVREAAKNNTTTTWTFRQGSSANTLRLKMTNAVSNFNDEAIVSLSNSGARTRTIADAGKLIGGALDLALVVDGNQFTVKDLNEGLATQTAGLAVRSHVSGVHTVSFSGLSTFAGGYSVMLHDAQTGTLSPLADNSELQINLTAGQTNTRYSLVFNSNVTSLGNGLSALNMSIYPNPTDGQTVTVQVDNATAGQNIVVNVRDMAGRLVYNHQVAAFGTIDKLEISKPLASGVYTVSTSVAGYTQTQKLVVR